MHIQRTRFAGDIVAEFLPPARKIKVQRVIILCSGMPSVPSKDALMEFLSSKGFWVFFPRYRGSWESKGKLLLKSPHLDVLDVIDQLPRGFKDLWTQKVTKLNSDQIIIIGNSFGGPAAILASKDKRVDKAVAISSVIDWGNPGKDESIDTLSQFTNDAFGQGYRLAKNGWTKLVNGNFYNPVTHNKDIDGAKLLLIHAKNDTICPYPQAKLFAKKTNASLISLPRGGHLSSTLLAEPRFYKQFEKFINT